MTPMIRCDPDGVPSFVQHIHYRHADMQFIVTLFNGDVRYVPAERACPRLGITDTPNDTDYVDVEIYLLTDSGRPLGYDRNT